MKNYLLYEHGGSGNHGCEALVRSTVKLLKDQNCNFVLSSYRPDEDIAFGLDVICKIVKYAAAAPIPRLVRYPRAILRRMGFGCSIVDIWAEGKALGIRRKDIALSIGGDNYCYPGYARLIWQHNKLKRLGVKTVLWGCSVEPELLNNAEIAEDMRQYDLITAREGISYQALKKINPNTVQVCDTAFYLDTADVPLPEGFEAGAYVCINTSPLAETKEYTSGIARKNFLTLIKYILANTNLKILLLPHVTWSHDDDRSVLQAIKQDFSEDSRVIMAQPDNCQVLKRYIAGSRFFIGARTHASIAAYSTCVPTLVVGYSVKSRGIAHDLFGTDVHYVLPVQQMRKPEDLTNAFLWLMKNEDMVRNTLENVIPSYKERIFNGVSALKSLKEGKKCRL